MTVVHLRDVIALKQALHFHYAGFKPHQLTDDIKQVTCKTCLRMIKRAERVTKYP